MIFVTIGTTIPFDGLVRAVDTLKASGYLAEDVVCQIGNGEFEPKYCEFFRFAPSLADYLDRASLVISHGGTGSVFGLLTKEKRFVAVANPAADGDHQREFLVRMEQETGLTWVDDLAGLEEAIAEARPLSYSGPGAQLVAAILEEIPR